jgi:alpha-1,2-mannosyltransferase
VSTPPSAARATPATPTVGRIRLAFVAQAGLIGSAAVIYAIVLSQAGLRHQDFDAYLAAARDIWHGQPLYTIFLHHPFPDPTLRPAYIYPPIFAVLVAPLGLLPDAVAGLLWLLIEQASLAAAMILVLRWLRPVSWAVTGLLCATLTFYPLWVDAAQGQANLVVTLLVTAGIVGVLKGQPRFAVALGLAAALKLTPAILLIWLLLERRRREAAWMVTGFLAITAMGALLRFQDTLTFFAKVVPALAPGTAVYANQSLSGFVRRIFTANPYTQPWIVLPFAYLLPAILAILLIAWWFWRMRHRQALARAAAFIPLVPLVSSVSWPHHLVILLPAIWLSAIAIAERDWPVAPTVLLAGLLLLFSVGSRWPAGPAFDQPGFRVAQTTDPMVFVTANALFFGTLILFLSAPWLLRSR